MLTPQEVAEHAFAKATFGGYNMAMVDEFLDELTDDYTSLYKENAALKAKMKVLVDKVEEYRATEDSMRSALLAAQKMASSMVSEAEERKETLLADAEMQARAKIGALHDEIVAEQKRLNAVKAATADFIAQTRRLCEGELRVLEAAPDLTPEQIEQTSTEARLERESTENVAALGDKIVANYEREREESGHGEANAAETALFPAAKAEKPAAPVDENLLEKASATFTDDATRPITLSELKFGRNYKGEEEG